MNAMDCGEDEDEKMVSLGTPASLKSPQCLHFTDKPLVPSLFISIIPPMITHRYWLRLKGLLHPRQASPCNWTN